MKLLKLFIISSIATILLFGSSCDSMTDNFKQYMEEYNYSGKIDSLRVYPGLNRVILAWDNPKDQKSKSIKIVYGPDSLVKTYDTLVDSVSIDGLDAGTGYEFTVYTVDAYNNLSVPTSITAFPVSQDFVNTLTPPSIVIQTVGADQYITLMGTSNIVMSFAGKIEYTITAPVGFTMSDEINMPELKGLTEIHIPVAMLLPFPFLPPGEYTFDYKVSVFPILGNLTTIDEVWLSKKTTLKVEPVIINLMTIPGKVSDKYNTGGGEGIEKLIDGSPSSKYLTFNPTTWMLWSMNRTFSANKYILISGNDAPSRDPKNWILEGSNDGNSWTKLDEQRDIIFSERFQRKTFVISNPQPFSKYRLTVTANNGSNIFQLAEWTLYYDSGM